MIHWFSTDAKQELLNDHCRKFGKEAFVNVLAEMMFLEDDQVMEMLASFCMPVSPAEYCEMMIKHIKQVGLWEVDKIVPLKDYRDKVQAKVERALTEMTWFDDFFRSNASSRELECLPKLKWRKDGNSVFNIMLECLHPFKDNFFERIGEDVLKECRDLEGTSRRQPGFITLCRSVNNEYAGHSETYRRLEAAWTPWETPAKLRKRIEEEQEQQRKFIAGAGPRDGAYPRPYRSAAPAATDTQVRPAHSYTPRVDPARPSAPVHGLGAIERGAPDPPRGAPRPYPKSAEPGADPNADIRHRYPCRIKAKYASCREVGCPYNHNDGLCADYAMREYAEYANSPYVKSREPAALAMCTTVRETLAEQGIGEFGYDEEDKDHLSRDRLEEVYPWHNGVIAPYNEDEVALKMGAKLSMINRVPAAAERPPNPRLGVIRASESADPSPARLLSFSQVTPRPPAAPPRAADTPLGRPAAAAEVSPRRDAARVKPTTDADADATTFFDEEDPVEHLPKWSLRKTKPTPPDGTDVVWTSDDEDEDEEELEPTHVRVLVLFKDSATGIWLVALARDEKGKLSVPTGEVGTEGPLYAARRTIYDELGVRRDYHWTLQGHEYRHASTFLQAPRAGPDVISVACYKCILQQRQRLEPSKGGPEREGEWRPVASFIKSLQTKDTDFKGYDLGVHFTDVLFKELKGPQQANNPMYPRLSYIARGLEPHPIHEYPDELQERLRKEHRVSTTLDVPFFDDV